MRTITTREPRHYQMRVLLVFNLFFCVISYAQPNFTSADMPNIGDIDTINYLNYQPITNNLDTETGNGYSWDFSSLPFSTYPNFIRIDSFRVKKHILSKDFPDATIEEYVYDGTAGDLFLYSYRNDTLFTHRSGQVVSGLVPVPPMPTIAFPIEFGKSSVLSYDFHVAIYTTGRRTTTFKYDGFGTLKMPNNRTFTNVFRVKKVEKDTNYITNTSSIGTSYIWYKQGGQIPILRFAYAGVSNLYFAFGSKSKNITTGILDSNYETDFSIFPNPSNGKFEIAGLGFTPEKVEIHNMLGEKVYQNNTVSEIDLASFPKGIYTVNISSGKTIFSKRIVLN